TAGQAHRPRLARRSARGHGLGNGSLFERTVPRHVLRRRHRRGHRAARGFPRGARRMPRGDARVARGRVEHGRFHAGCVAGVANLRKEASAMASVNKVIIIGNLGRDPETRYMPEGGAITNISVATTEKWKDKNGEMQEKTAWHRVAFFGKLGEIAG